MTVIVLLTLDFQSRAPRWILGSLMISSTPGGIDIGVRPSFDWHPGVVENCRGLVANVVCHAGTRNRGRDTACEENMAWRSALPLQGAIVAAIGFGLTGGRGFVSLRLHAIIIFVPKHKRRPELFGDDSAYHVHSERVSFTANPIDDPRPS